jgi:hypothetical protein
MQTRLSQAGFAYGCSVSRSGHLTFKMTPEKLLFSPPHIAPHNVLSVLRMTELPVSQMRRKRPSLDRDAGNLPGRAAARSQMKPFWPQAGSPLAGSFLSTAAAREQSGVGIWAAKFDVNKQHNILSMCPQIAAVAEAMLTAGGRLELLFHRKALLRVTTIAVRRHSSLRSSLENARQCRSGTSWR